MGRGSANDPLRAPLDVIASVHGDGTLPIVPLVWDSRLDVRARFVIRDGVPSAIAVKPGAAVAIPVIHEVGHLVDYSAVDGFGAYASAGSPRLARWLTLVGESQTVRALTEEIERSLRLVADDDEHRRVRLSALTEPEELWARCYVQYVIRRSGQVELLGRLETERVGTVEGFELPLHWGDDEFVPIDDEIEQVFWSLGWRANQRPDPHGKPRRHPSLARTSRPLSVGRSRRSTVSSATSSSSHR